MVRLDHCVQAWLRASAAPTTSLKEAHRRVLRGDFSVGGAVVTNPKMQLVPSVDVVQVVADGTAISTGDHLFCLLHKPAGVVCQRHPREANVYDLIPPELRRDDLACVGRLDRDTTGTMLLTTDGGLQAMLLHPQSRVWKTYTATLAAPTLSAGAAATFQGGMTLEDGTACAPAALDVLSPTSVRVTLHEGFFHQVTDLGYLIARTQASDPKIEQHTKPALSEGTYAVSVTGEAHALARRGRRHRATPRHVWLARCLGAASGADAPADGRRALLDPRHAAARSRHEARARPATPSRACGAGRAAEQGGRRG